MIFDKITKPSDLKNLNIEELITLCSELRSEIIRITAKNGGHLGSNLGAIEMIVAIHYVFDIEEDKLLFDVGHQAYAHKLLTGRRAIMERLRTKSGASGFPDPEESKYDHFISGHASTSISAALGIAKARDLDKKHYNVISIFGDGSLSGGMIYEAMNNIAGTKNFIAILNDNQMSISESVGSMKTYLAKLLATQGGLTLRKSINKILSSLPNALSKKIEIFIKSSINRNNIFEEFGFKYIRVLDGHDLKKLIKIFTNIKSIAPYKPILVHVITKKGNGYDKAENDLTKLHGIDTSKKTTKYSDIFGDTIVKIAKNDKKIVCITAAMKTGTGLSEFANEFPERFFDVGIAEEHAVTFAAGLAKQGYKPFVCIYSTFLRRAFDQIYHDVVLQNLPVKFIIDKSGFPGADGKTHSGLFDISMLQNFSNMTILAPSGKNELIQMINFASKFDNTPLSIRFPKSQVFNDNNIDNFSLKSKVIAEGKDTLILSIGDMLSCVIDAVRLTNRTPTIIDARVVQPFDWETFSKYAEHHEKIIVIEEGVLGGISNVILENIQTFNKGHILHKLKFIQAKKDFPCHDSRNIQLAQSHMLAKDIIELLN